MTDLASRSLELTTVRESAREVDFICSTETIDSYDSVIRQRWRTERYMRNPVVLFAHDSRELPIGQATNVRVEKNQLVATLRIASAEANPKAEYVWRSIVEGSLRGLSVGFYPNKVTEEEIDGRSILVLDDNELLELSIVPIPANPETLVKLRQRAHAAGHNTDHATHPAPQGTPADKRGEQRESRMDLEKENAALKAKLEQRDADVATREKSIAEERTAKAALERELDKARTDAKAAHDRAVKAEEAVVERDVSALVGVKIAPAEKDEMLELAKTNRVLFDKLIAKRANLGGGEGLISGSVLPADAPQERALGTNDHDKLFSDFEKSLGN